MPQCFREKLPNTACIIHCTETTLPKLHYLDFRGESYSHCFSSNTFVYLVATALCGLVRFISGGRCCNKFITLASWRTSVLEMKCWQTGFLSIRDLLFERRVNRVLPALTQRGGQLSDEDITGTRRIANGCMHVEKVVRRRMVFKIISHSVPAWHIKWTKSSQSVQHLWTHRLRSSMRTMVEGGSLYFEKIMISSKLEYLCILSLFLHLYISQCCTTDSIIMHKKEDVSCVWHLDIFTFLMTSQVLNDKEWLSDDLNV